MSSGIRLRTLAPGVPLLRMGILAWQGRFCHLARAAHTADGACSHKAQYPLQPKRPGARGPILRHPIRINTGDSPRRRKAAMPSHHAASRPCTMRVLDMNGAEYGRKHEAPQKRSLGLQQTPTCGYKMLIPEVSGIFYFPFVFAVLFYSLHMVLQGSAHAAPVIRGNQTAL